jgi:diacylglycerol O-acyltransferase / wax synthase
MGDGVDRLSAEDRLTLWPDEVWPQDIGALVLLDGSPLLDASGEVRLEAIREVISSRLHLLPRFRQVVHEPPRGLGGPLWVDAPAFDLDDHLHVARVPAPGDEEQLLATVERIRRQRLDRRRPLWELWVLTGLADGRVGLFVRLHHVVADGMAGVASVAVFLDPGAAVTPMTAPTPWTPTPAPSRRALAADALGSAAGRLRARLAMLVHPVAMARRARAGWPALRELIVGSPGPRTSFGGVIGPDRALALVRADLERVRQAAHAHETTVNDVLLMATAGGGRALLASRGDPVDVTVPIYIPVTLRRAGTALQGGNLISQMVVHLPLGVPDPVERLRRIAAETAQRKREAHPSLGTMFHNKLLSGAMLKLIIRQHINLTSADLPGPTAPLHLAGARVLEVFPLLNLIGNVTLGVGALSYTGQLGVLVVADAATFPDLDVFAQAMRKELDALAAATHTVGVQPS